MKTSVNNIKHGIYSGLGRIGIPVVRQNSIRLSKLLILQLNSILATHRCVGTKSQHSSHLFHRLAPANWHELPHRLLPGYRRQTEPAGPARTRGACAGRAGQG